MVCGAQPNPEPLAPIPKNQTLVTGEGGCMCYNMHAHTHVFAYSHHKFVLLTGFLISTGLASGVRDGIQKLGSFLLWGLLLSPCPPWAVSLMLLTLGPTHVHTHKQTYRHTTQTACKLGCQQGENWFYQKKNALFSVTIPSSMVVRVVSSTKWLSHSVY